VIGGCDLLLVGAVSASDRDYLLRALRAHWPDGLVEDALTDQAPVSIRSAVALCPGWTEFFAYRDAAAQADCELHGVTSHNRSGFLHLLLGPEELTVVVHEPAGPTALFVEDLLMGLTNKRNTFPAEAA